MIDQLNIKNKSIVSISELNQVLDFAKQKQNIEIKISFSNPIKKIDIVFIAGLLLLGRQKNIKYGIEYKGQFDRIFEIRHYLMQFQKLYERDWSYYFNVFKGILKLQEDDFIASESFAPIVVINKKTINDFFVETDHQKIRKGIFDLSEKYIQTKLCNKKSNQDEIKYFESARSIKIILNEYPVIYGFVFTILYNKVNPFVKSKEKGIDKPVQRIEELWEFTIEYVKGLHELAKNIVEHSGTGNGMITIRAYDVEEDDEKNVDKVLETHVFDYGEKGVIPSLIQFTEVNKEKNKLYNEDLKILQNSFTIQDFIKPTSDKLLQQQLHREIAHYGLMRFNRLIEKNEGNVICSSIRKDGENDKYQYNEVKKEKSINVGTSYFFQLPFKPNLFKVNSNFILSSELQGTPQTIAGLAKLLNLKLVDKTQFESKNTEHSEKIILDYEFVETINNRGEEDSAYMQVKEFIGNNFVGYVCLNMKEAKLSFSNLLRLSALLSNNLSQSIIVYNLNYEVYETMIEDYTQFYAAIKLLKSDIPFWNEDKGILFFTKIIDPNFNFADVLFGKTIEEFETVNHIVSHTFPNSLIMTQQIISKIPNYQIHQCLSPYFYQSSLLPFDVLLKNEGNKTLFQSNLEVLISQELKTVKNKENQSNE